MTGNPEFSGKQLFNNEYLRNNTRQTHN